MGKARSAPASAAVQEEWLRRVEAEYRSTAIAAHLAHWLVQIGASPDLVRASLRIAREELGHATTSHAVYAAAGGTGGPRLERASLELQRHPEEPLEHDVARVCVEIFCLGETVAVRLFRELRQRCDVPRARRVLDRILRDEVGHRDFGWSLLDWLLAHPGAGEGVRDLVSRELPGAMDRLRGLYAAPLSSSIPTADARWGLTAPLRYRDIVEASLARDCLPRFARLGIAGPPGTGRLAQAGVRE